MKLGNAALAASQLTGIQYYYSDYYYIVHTGSISSRYRSARLLGRPAARPAILQLHTNLSVLPGKE